MASIPTLSSSLPTISSSNSNFNNHSPSTFLTLPLTSLFGTTISLQRPSSTPFLLNNNIFPPTRAFSPTLSFSLPTKKPQTDGEPAKTLKWSARAIKSFAMGELEARKLKYPNTGTEALLMGILVEGTSHAAKFLRANGITLFQVRDETVELLGKSDMYFFSPEHPPLTEPAQKALNWAVDEKFKSGEEGEITVTHILLGIWSQEESAARSILAALGFNDEKAQELAKIKGDIDLSFKKQI
ncbi:hypothetical protein TanjilG_19973 [Lupinus angustifolius]|uniref:Clp R domain-containing protein n=1 Tax=Lupinus angustifolius TaxID=3871 RepID=A0A4P1RBS4_LUPAN|nr:PREDICTED: ATP-dependent Clp protease ATP-binding subunit CLPT1, chloroplastic-like [Lupinus angustifolius]XP_019449430.1 PREDICTED: ATP-dependent Clp protease ATP-binding subunit CLPT1, chloroplastic-like [Lupinus angustifolius]OIW07872.1 hypothetical protein TanjilG_19973 [Lupinus angustifolius]